jgi:hypothetical protein
MRTDNVRIVDLCPDDEKRILEAANLLKVGFVIVGVMPDANGWGKPDIFMAKRVQLERGS